MNVESQIIDISKAARTASIEMAKCSTGKKNEVLKKIAENIMNEASYLKTENKKDLTAATEKGLSNAMIDRLTITGSTIDSIVDGLNDIIKLDDPVGSITKTWNRPNGLQISKMRIPLGVIGIIYESRPNVTIDAASLCLKAGNCVILRGGSESIHSNNALAKILGDALSATGLPKEAAQVIPMSDRPAVNYLLAQEEFIDLIIPRGGEGLIRFVVENSKIPVLKHYKGVCHIYVDENADLQMAENICFNAKVQRPGVCNAMETLLVNEKIAGRFLPSMYEKYSNAGVELRGCSKTKTVLNDVASVGEEDWHAEYLDLILAVKTVRNMDEAIDHIATYSSNHTESIITTDYNRARQFVREVDSSTVIVNASTRFSDGHQLGLGAEIGISTTKLHAFGPMGLDELTTTKFIIFGNGQIRE